MVIKNILRNVWSWLRDRKEILIKVWCGYLIISLMMNLSHEWRACLEIYSYILQDKAIYLVPNFFMCFLVLAIAMWLSRIHRVFQWSWLGNNLGLLPIQKEYIGPLFLLLLILNMPSITHMEERIFRSGLENWYDGLVWSVIFGLSHCLVGVPLAYGIASIALGVWLTWCYLTPGPRFAIFFSTLNHTSYNLVACMMMVIFMIYSRFKKEDAK